MRSHGSRDTEREPASAPKAVSRQPAADVGRAGLLGLQRAVGNDAVARMLRRAGHAGAQGRHRHGTGCGHAGEPGQAEAAPTVQRSAVHDVLRGSGRPLDETTRTDMERRLGADFSDVRLYTGAEASRSAAQIGARAYTSGKHVVIGNGGGDRHTLAHELTHVIQQRRGPVAGTDNGEGLSVSDPGDRFEREAEANARRALSGPAGAETAHAGHSAYGHGPQGGAGASAVQRVKRGREESTEGEISEDAVNLIASPMGREDTYAGGQGRRIPKTPEGAACWEWAVRAAADSGGIDRGEFWNYLLSMVDDEEVREIEQLEPAVRSDLDQLRNNIAAAGLSFNLEDLDAIHDEAEILPFMQQSVQTFVQAHGLRIDAGEPAGWIMCQYKMDGDFGVPEHFWIELPVPGGGRVLLQTVPDIPYIEAGGTDLRWHDENSVEERQGGHETYRTIEVPVAALKGRHSEIINGIMARGRRTRRKPTAVGASGRS
ncbi:eCIS core domain-containing protein [Streptomyces laculatispora]